mmetsp:Transcript_17263/g.48604  ORF Transcript_17263/g.48604 Transcript_17263/m.48604 type:complete len:203 (-) Transcript_17263:459-1067(-)
MDFSGVAGGDAIGSFVSNPRMDALKDLHLFTEVNFTRLVGLPPESLPSGLDFVVVFVLVTSTLVSTEDFVFFRCSLACFCSDTVMTISSSDSVVMLSAFRFFFFFFFLPNGPILDDSFFDFFFSFLDFFLFSVFSLCMARSCCMNGVSPLLFVVVLLSSLTSLDDSPDCCSWWSGDGGCDCGAGCGRGGGVTGAAGAAFSSP